MFKKMKLGLALALAVVTVTGMIPTVAFAEEDTNTANETVDASTVTEGTNETDEIAASQDAQTTETQNTTETQTDAKTTETQSTDDANAENGIATTSLDPEAEELETQATGNLITYTGHQQTYGDLTAVSDGAVLGVTGESKRFEGLTISKGAATQNVSGEINYRVHVQTYGNQDWRTTGQLAGTTGESKRLEGLQMYLSGEMANKYDIYYRVHIQTYGWMNWAKGGTSADNAAWSGSSGLGKRLEAVQIVLVKKGGSAPAADPACQTSQSYVTPTSFGTVMYSGHQQTYGDLSAVADGTTLGVTGEAKRIEAITVTKSEGLSNLSGDIHYQVHVQTYGRQDWVSSGQQAGTTGQGKRLEAFRMSLSGELANNYDIYYRVHAQSLGWMAWTKGGSSANDENAAWAGTADFARRLEAIQIVMVPKGASPASTNPENATAISYVDRSTDVNVSYAGIQEGTTLSAVSGGTTLGVTGQSKKFTAIQAALTGNAGSNIPGSINYRTYMQTTEWSDWGSNNQLVGNTDNAKRMEAIEMNLSGAMGAMYNIYYRVHVQHYGWLGWAMNGQTAGTDHFSYRIEAIEIKLVPKTSAAPGANEGYYISGKAKTVYIDAGHGGSDSGATNGSRYEKNDTLVLALAVQQKLQESGINVVMARTDDDASYKGVTSLYSRVERANAAGADYYVSIHRDSAGSSARGFTIYTHNPNNDNIEDRRNPNELSNKDADSYKLSQNIANALNSVGSMPFRGIVRGSAGDDSSIDLIVNKYSNMPSCLVEMGFISNATDNAAFDANLDAHADAIANGVLMTISQ